jgi:hypothetical protein
MFTELGVEITIHRLRPPLGGVYYYAAKIRPVHTGEHGTPVRFRLPFDEVWGESEDETRQKAAAMVARLMGNVPMRAPSAKTWPDGQISDDIQQNFRSEGEIGAVVATVDATLALSPP